MLQVETSLYEYFLHRTYSCYPKLPRTRGFQHACIGAREIIDKFCCCRNVFFTATGRPGAIPAESFNRLPDGAILANAGHFSWEIDLAELRRRAVTVERFREWVELFTLEDGRRITLLAQGEMLNLAGGGGNPIETMDLGFALQAQSLVYLTVHHRDLPHGPQPVPGEINATVARWMVENLSRRGSSK